MTERLRAVFDTNVFVSALLSRNPTSPTQELLRRWRNEEFILLVSQALLLELVGKLQARHRTRSDPGTSGYARPPGGMGGCRRRRLFP